MIVYPIHTTERVRERLALMDKDGLWDLIYSLEIPTDDQPLNYDWEHKELRQRIVDWLFDPDFKVLSRAKPKATADSLLARAQEILDGEAVSVEGMAIAKDLIAQARGLSSA